jgi:hypothetical protein
MSPVGGVSINLAIQDAVAASDGATEDYRACVEETKPLKPPPGRPACRISFLRRIPAIFWLDSNAIKAIE